MNKRELIELLNKKANEISDNPENDKVEPWNNPDIKAKIQGEKFKKVCSVRNFNEHCYYISNFGRMLVINVVNAKIENKETIILAECKDINETNCWVIPIVNGYLTPPKSKTFPSDLKISQYTDVYKYMIDSGWLDEDKSKNPALKIVENNIKTKEYSNDRIELHHIDNNPSNNSLDNLVWLPKSIHQKMH